MSRIPGFELRACVLVGALGGCSLYSEVFSFEVRYRYELAELLKTEGEIASQDAGGTKTDPPVSVDSLATGVRVTRAFKSPPTEPYTVADARPTGRSIPRCAATPSCWSR